MIFVCFSATALWKVRQVDNEFSGVRNCPTSVIRTGSCCFVEFMTYIFADLRNRGDLAFAWMYQEYANMQGYNVLSLAPNKQSAVGYDTCLTDLLTGLLDRPDHKEGSVLILSNVLISLEICVLCVCISYSRTTQDESVPDAANSLASCPLSLLSVRHINCLVLQLGSHWNIWIAPFAGCCPSWCYPSCVLCDRVRSDKCRCSVNWTSSRFHRGFNSNCATEGGVSHHSTTLPCITG